MLGLQKIDNLKIFNLFGIRFLLHVDKNRTPQKTESSALPEEIAISRELANQITLNRFVLKSNNFKKALIVTCELSFNGAALCVFQLLDHLVENGYSVAVLTYKDGPLKEKLYERGVDSFLIPDVYKFKDEFLSIAKEFDLVLCNTIATYDAAYLSKFVLQKKVFWWCHEAKLIHELKHLYQRRFGLPNLPEVLAKPIEIHTVSSYSKKYLLEFSNHVSLFKYKVKLPTSSTLNSCKHSKIQLLTIGVEYRKGTDILINVMRLLSQNSSLSGAFDLHIIGNISSEFSKQLQVVSSDLPNVYWHGYVEDDEKNRLIESSDLLLCFSRDDPLPSYVSEGYSMRKAALVGPNCGHYDLINDKHNGFVVPNLNEKCIVNKLAEILEHSASLQAIGNEAFDIYKLNFTEEIFNSELSRIINSSWFKNETQHP